MSATTTTVPKKLSENPAIKGRIGLFSTPGEIPADADEFLSWFQEQTELFAKDVAAQMPAYTDVGRTIASFDALMHYRQVVYDAVMIGVPAENARLAAAKAAEEAARLAAMPASEEIQEEED